MKTRPANYSPVDEGTHRGRLEIRVNLPPLGNYSSLRDLLDSTKEFMVVIVLISFFAFELTHFFLVLGLLPKGNSPSPFLSGLGLIVSTGFVVTLISALVFSFVGRLAKAKRDAITYRMMTMNDKFVCKMENDLLNSLTLSKG